MSYMHTKLSVLRWVLTASKAKHFEGEITISSKTLPILQNHTMTYNLILLLFTTTISVENPRSTRARYLCTCSGYGVITSVVRP
jgi:hypothetical protein